MFMVDEAKAAFDRLKKSRNAQEMAQVEEANIKPASQQALQAKYQALLQQAMYVPKWLVNKTVEDNNLLSNVSYVYAPYSAVPDSSVKVSDDEIMAYSNKHKDEYKRDEETRNIAYVTFNADPSSADSLAAFNAVLAKKAELASNTNINTFFAQNTSDLPYYDGYISKNQIHQKSIDSIVKLPVNGVYGPYLDGNEYVIAKLIAVKQLPDSAKVRHILVATH
jgi:peptidyl-prolyl cis-trans isomerase D